jgi:hypothetical protein
MVMVSDMRDRRGVRLGALLRDESGIAMIIVVGVVTVLFLLTTMLVVVSNYMLSSGRQQEVRVKTVHTADGGLNAYLYELRRDSTYYQTNPVLGPIVQDDGVWYVRAEPPTATSPLTLRAEGRLNSQATSKTVVATVRFPTFADYMFLSNDDINFGAAARVLGKVRSNGNIDNAGEITGATYARGTIGGTGRFGTALPSGSVTKFPNQTVVDFSQVTADTTVIAAAATAVGTNYASAGTGYVGYRVTVSGNTFTVEKVKSVTSNGTMVVESITGQTGRTIPAVGVLYFSSNTQDVWVQGTYSVPITICAMRDIYVMADYKPTDPTSRNTAGLVANRDIVVPISYNSVPNDMVLTAALLAQTGKTFGTQTTGVIKNSLTLKGSNSYYLYGYFVTTDGSGSVVAGFRTRYYLYDDRLDLYAPPRYPVVHDGSLKVNTWVED